MSAAIKQSDLTFELRCELPFLPGIMCFFCQKPLALDAAAALS